MKKRASCDQKSCFLCRNSLSGWLPAIASHKKNILFKKGQRIFEAGQPVNAIYFLYTGKAKIHQPWGAQKELIVKFAGPGDIIGYRGLGKQRIYPITATVLEPSLICSIDLSFFEDSLRANHQLTYELMLFYANELQEAERRMRDLAHLSVKGRLADTLLQLRQQFGLTKEGFINISLTRQDIASYAGTTYETLFRTMAELVREKLITVNGKNIKIMKDKNLEKLRSAKLV